MGGKKIEGPSIGLAVATDKALKFLAGYAISEARVIAVLGKPKHEWASEDIASLRGMASLGRAPELPDCPGLNSLISVCPLFYPAS